MTRRQVRAGLLFGFALLIVKLFIAGEMVKYMSPALDPLTALTGVLLALMGAMELRGDLRDAGGAEDHANPTDQALTVLLLLVPLILGLVVPPRALGSSALGGEDVSRLLLTFGSSGRTSAAGSAPPAPPTPIDDVPELLTYLQQVGELGVGQRVRVIGLVARSPTLPSNELVLLRYAITHCVADARALGLLVIPPNDAGWLTDQWVQIDGALNTREREGDRLVSIVADTIEPIDEPPNPYLSGT